MKRGDAPPSDFEGCIYLSFDDGDENFDHPRWSERQLREWELNQALVTFELMQAPDRRHQH